MPKHSGSSVNPTQKTVHKLLHSIPLKQMKLLNEVNTAERVSGSGMGNLDYITGKEPKVLFYFHF